MFKIKIILSLMLFISCLKGPEHCSITKEENEQYFRMNIDKVCLEVELLGPQLPEKYCLKGNKETKETLLFFLDTYKFQLGNIGFQLPSSELICFSPNGIHLDQVTDLDKDNLDYLVGMFDFACEMNKKPSMSEEGLSAAIRRRLEEKFPSGFFMLPHRLKLLPVATT